MFIKKGNDTELRRQLFVMPQSILLAINAISKTLNNITGT